MSYSPTTISRLEATLCKHGHKSDGDFPLNPRANDEGHEWYPDCLMMKFGRTRVDFSERYSEKKVEMNAFLTPQQLVKVAQVFAETHGSSRNLIQVKAIVTVTTAATVCDVLRG